jgi:hypothetical protein
MLTNFAMASCSSRARKCSRRLRRSCARRPGRPAVITLCDALVALAVLLVGAGVVGIVVPTSFAADEAAVQARLAVEAAYLLDRMRWMFEPAVSLLRATVAACAQMHVDLGSWNALSGPLMQVYASALVFV